MVKTTSINSRVAETCGLDTKTVNGLSEHFTEIMQLILSEGDSVAIPSFGEFRAVKTDEYVETDPAGKRMLMPPAIKIEFSPSNVLRKKLQ